MIRFLSLALALALPAAAPVEAQGRPPLVLAAASLQEAMTAAADVWARRGHPRPVVSFAASSALARQVEAGGAADLFVSADTEWMDALAARRLIVEDKLFEPLVDTIHTMVGRLIVGAPHDDPQPFMGPVIDNQVADMLTESFLALLMRGGRPVRHLERPRDDRPFLIPAIIDMTGATERPDIELFGPILQVQRAHDFDAAIAEANDTRYGLSAALVSQTPALYDRFWSGIRAGIVNWNRPTNGASSSAPFGGVGWSGNHRPSAYYAADYCAYPVVSNEADAARANIGIGLRDA